MKINILLLLIENGDSIINMLLVGAARVLAELSMCKNNYYIKANKKDIKYRQLKIYLII